jgi:hypothetical protein
MKKSFLLLIAAALLAACSSNEMTVELKEKPIGFSRVYIDKSTKAIRKGPYTTDNFGYVGNTFGVIGYKTTATQTNAKVFNDVKVEYQTGLSAPFAATDWAYSPLVYWDKTATQYSFFAYAPHSGDFTGTVALGGNDATTFSITGFKQATTVANQIDLMTDLTNQNNVTANIGNNDVKFTFGHILSNINVTMAVSAALKADETDNPVSVETVTLGTITMDGSYAYDSGASAYKWTLSTSSPTTQLFSATQSSGNVFASKALTATPAAVPGLTGMLMIPQAVNANYEIYVKYKINTEVFERTIKLSDFKKSGTSLGTWDPGYKYTYNIVIGPTPILFDIIGVSDWGDGGVYTYTIE